MWSASNQLLFPSWKGASSDFSVCPQALAAAWGEGCGNLRRTQQLRFEEVQVSSTNGYALPGWLIRAADNGRAPADGPILLVHGGGSDRRETSRHIAFLLERQLEVLTLDLGCHGEAPCPTPPSGTRTAPCRSGDGPEPLARAEPERRHPHRRLHEAGLTHRERELQGVRSVHGGTVQRSPWQNPRHSSDSTHCAPVGFRLAQAPLTSQYSPWAHCIGGPPTTHG